MPTGKPVARITIEMDVKGQAKMHCESIGSLGSSPLPLITASNMLSSCLQTVIQELTTQFVKGGSNGKETPAPPDAG